MAAKRTPGSRPGLIRCSHCGEEYSETYRRCPFCAEYDADVEYETQRIRSQSFGAAQSGQRTAPTRSAVSRGGKRVAYKNRRGGGYTRVSAGRIIAWLLSLIVIIAAVWILVTQVKPYIDNGEKVPNDVLNDPPSTSDPAVQNTPTGGDPAPSTSQDPDVSPSPEAPADTATGFTLNKKDFSFSSQYPDPVTLKVTFSPAGTTAAITWSSSDPDIAAVDQNGQVTYGAKRGSATITASMANGVTQTCTVYNQMKTGVAYVPPVEGSSDPEPSASRGSYKLNKTDFTFYERGESTKLRVDGYTGTIRWSSSNTNVCTVSSDGTVKAVGSGKRSCTITATLEDGTELEAIARISIS